MSWPRRSRCSTATTTCWWCRNPRACRACPTRAATRACSGGPRPGSGSTTTSPAPSSWVSCTASTGRLRARWSSPARASRPRGSRRRCANSAPRRSTGHWPRAQRARTRASSCSGSGRTSRRTGCTSAARGARVRAKRARAGACWRARPGARSTSSGPPAAGRTSCAWRRRRSARRSAATSSTARARRWPTRASRCTPASSPSSTRPGPSACAAWPRCRCCRTGSSRERGSLDLDRVPAEHVLPAVRRQVGRLRLAGELELVRARREHHALVVAVLAVAPFEHDRHFELRLVAAVVLDLEQHLALFRAHAPAELGVAGALEPGPNEALTLLARVALEQRAEVVRAGVLVAVLRIELAERLPPQLVVVDEPAQLVRHPGPFVAERARVGRARVGRPAPAEPVLRAHQRPQALHELAQLLLAQHALDVERLSVGREE